MTARLPPDTIAQFTPGRAALVAGVANTVDVQVRIQAPGATGDRPARPPMALSLVVDCSGSMQGRPLLEARSCAAQVVARLRHDDTLSLVRFDDHATRVLPAVPRVDGVGMTGALGRLQDSATTDPPGCWVHGAQGTGWPTSAPPACAS